MIMATVKVKFCPSSVTGKAGTVYYQLTHRREKQQIASDICLLPDQWETVIRSTATPDDATDSLQKRINNDVICLKRITDRLEKSNEPYSVHDIVRQWQGTCILASMQAQIDRLHRCKCLGTARNYKSALNSFARNRHPAGGTFGRLLCLQHRSGNQNKNPKQQCSSHTHLHFTANIKQKRVPRIEVSAR